MHHSYIESQYLVHFFESLIKSERFSKEASIREAMLNYLKSKTNLYLDTNFEKVLEEFPPSIKQVLTPILTQLSTGRQGTEICTGQNKPFYLLKKLQVYASLSQPFASYWVANHPNPIEKYRAHNPYYFLTDKDDLSVWESCSKSNTFYIGDKQRNANDKIMTSWDSLKKFSHPVRDFIISDRYCLKSQTGIKHNLIPMIANLCAIKDIVENIIFFVRPNELFTNKLPEVHSLVKQQLADSGINANVKIYTSNRTPHDRMILTNNMFIKSGDSFDYFNPDGSYKTNGTTLMVHPLFEVNIVEVKEAIKVWKSISDNSHMNYGDLTKNILDLIDF